ncbi:hypothetical protein CRUP_006727 [Coryphaenoides rupestris]|nr:hypothetical protein CRUP_006727 [Coryphaenoides rupestris]
MGEVDWQVGAVFITARAAAPRATVKPMTANRTKRRVTEGRATATVLGPAAPRRLLLASPATEHRVGPLLGGRQPKVREAQEAGTEQRGPPARLMRVSAVFITARAAAPRATVKPMTANRTKRRVTEGRATATVLGPAAPVISSAACFWRRRRRSTESGRCWADASPKSVKLGGRELNKEVPGAADEGLVREVLGDLRQEVALHVVRQDNRPNVEFSCVDVYAVDLRKASQ